MVYLDSLGLRPAGYCFVCHNKIVCSESQRMKELHELIHSAETYQLLARRTFEWMDQAHEANRQAFRLQRRKA